jgi:hypothetical protein
MRKDRPTRIASRSPVRTRRYTVRFDTRKIVAASKIVRNLVLVRDETFPFTALLQARCQLRDKSCCKLQ